MNLQDLIKELEKIVPDKFPRENIQGYEQGVIAGKLAIIDYLKSKLEELEKIK